MDCADPFAWSGVRRFWEAARPVLTELLSGLAFLALMTAFAALCALSSDYNWN